MPSWFRSTKRSGAESGKNSSPSTHSSSSHQQAPAHEYSNHYSNYAGPSQHRGAEPAHPYPTSYTHRDVSSTRGRPTTSHHRNISPIHNNFIGRPSTSHIPTRYPSHRSVSPLGTSRFEQPSPYTFTPRRQQHQRPQTSSSHRPHIQEVHQMGYNGYFGSHAPALPFRRQPEHPFSSYTSSNKQCAQEIPSMGYDGYYGASDTTVPHVGAGVGRRNAVRGRSDGERVRRVGGGASMGREDLSWERYLWGVR